MLALPSVSLSCPEPSAAPEATEPEADKPAAAGEEEPTSDTDAAAAPEEVRRSFRKSSVSSYSHLL